MQGTIEETSRERALTSVDALEQKWETYGEDYPVYGCVWVWMWVYR